MSDKKVLICGQDGYLGWALTVYLRSRGVECQGFDNFSRRENVRSVGSESLVPIEATDRVDVGCDMYLHRVHLVELLHNYKPTHIVHLGEQPSAPFSMKSVVHAASTQQNNVIGTMNLLWAMRDVCPEAHLIKLGTMGEYSDWIYRKFPIPEEPTISAMLMDEEGHQQEYLTIPTPKAAGSFYHWSKVFDSQNIGFACKIWGLRATDINQGVVYGSRIEAMGENNRTRFDYDSYFGTAVNRFIVQAIARHGLTVYGGGGQTRGYININDAMRAIELVMEHPPEFGRLDIVNQLTEVKSVYEVAMMVRDLTGEEAWSLDNPRVELEEHSYTPTFKKLKEWGLTEPRLMKDVLPEMIEDLSQFKDQINKEVLNPKTRWQTVKEQDKIAV